MTRNEVRDSALGAVSEWIGGYTDPDDEGWQSWVKVLGEDYGNGVITVSVEHPANSGKVKGYLIEVRVTGFPLGSA